MKISFLVIVCFPILGGFAMADGPEEEDEGLFRKGSATEEGTNPSDVSSLQDVSKVKMKNTLNLKPRRKLNECISCTDKRTPWMLREEKKGRSNCTSRYTLSSKRLLVRE